MIYDIVGNKIKELEVIKTKYKNEALEILNNNSVYSEKYITDKTVELKRNYKNEVLKYCDIINDLIDIEKTKIINGLDNTTMSSENISVLNNIFALVDRINLNDIELNNLISQYKKNGTFMNLLYKHLGSNKQYKLDEFKNTFSEYSKSKDLIIFLNSIALVNVNMFNIEILENAFLTLGGAMFLDNLKKQEMEYNK